MGDVDAEMTSSLSNDDEELDSISISLPEEDDEEKERDFDYFNRSQFYVDRKIQWPALRPFGAEQEEEAEDTMNVSLDSSEEDEGPYSKRERPYSNYNFSSKSNYFSFSQPQRYSESSLSSPSTPEPLKGKLCLTEGGRIGLSNLGNTCYLNSTLQCLTAARELSYKLAEDYEEGTMPSKIFLQVTSRLFHEMWQSGGKTSSIRRIVTPSQFKSVLGRIDSRFSGYRQEDSQEALAIILDKLHEDLKESVIEDIDGDSDGWMKYCRKENSLVRRLFHGQLKSSITCQRCSFRSETFDPFSVLNLPIPNDEKSAGNSRSVYRNPIIPVKPNIQPRSFRVFCYNDRIYNAESSYLIMRREFKNMSDFRMFYRGGSYWIVELQDSQVISVRTKLPSLEDLSEKNSLVCYVAYPADISKQNFLVSFVSGKTRQSVGFPILLRKGLSEGLSLTPSEFISGFLKGIIRDILKHRFPNRLEFFDAAVGLMLASANEYFQVEVVESDNYYLKQVNVIILNDKSDFNDLIFFKDVSDPNDLFEDLFINLCDTADENEENKEEDNAIEEEQVSEEAQIADNHVTTLVDCFNRLLSVEKLSETDNWKCEKCQVAVCAEKKLELWRLPELMIVHLKRFSYGGSTGEYYGQMMSYLASYTGGSKITKAIDFPLELDMTQLMGQGSPVSDCNYELFAISQHSGSLDYGHYTAIVRHEASGKWMLMDDSHVHVYDSVEEWLNSRVKELAYVLFYRRTNK